MKVENLVNKCKTKGQVTNLKVLYSIFILLMAFTSTSCKQTDNQDFNFLGDDSTGKGEAELQAVEILSTIPTSNPVRVTSATTTTFLVTTNTSAGDDVIFTWKLNGALLASGSDSFYELSGAAVSPGLNTLEVEASNLIGSDSKIFSVEKNSVPVIDSQSPSSGGNTVACGGGVIQFTVNASDVNSDALNYSWKLNGVPHSTYYSVTTGPGNSINDFTPPCSLSGANTVSVDVSDGYDTISASWSVSVTNPTVAQIVGYTPLMTPVVIPSTGSNSFSISASGKIPLAYEWKLNGTAIPGEVNSFINVSAASLAVGTHTLTAVVSDYDSSDSQNFVVKRNAPPVLTNATPTESSLKMNYQTFKTFSIDGSDGNSDTITYTWTLDDVASVYLAASATTMGSQAIFSPDITLTGSHTIKVIANDGTETTTQSWTVEVNFFREACNNLQAGQICTLVGSPGKGSGINPSTYPQIAKVRPVYIANDGSDNYFISDDVNDVVWFYNRSAGAVSVLGTTIPAGEIKIVVGTGAQGYGTANSSAINYRLYNPYGIAWDSSRQELYISLYSIHQIVRVTSTGIVRHDICSGSSGNDWARNTEGAAATSQGCRNPAGLAFDGARNRLYVANYSGHNIKYFNVADANPTNWTGHLYVCRQNSGGACLAGSDNGNIGGGGTSTSMARTNGPWDLDLDSNGVLYFTEYSGRRIRGANDTGTNYSYLGGGRLIDSGKATTLYGTGSDTTSPGLYTAVSVRRPRGLKVYDVGGTIYGWFNANDDYDRITFVNNTAGTLQIGGRNIAAYNGHYVWGNGQDGYNGDISPAYNSLINYAWGLEMSIAGDSLLLADRGNYRVRSLDVSTGNGNLATTVEGKETNDFSGGANSPAPTSVMNSPTQLAYDATNNTLLFSDADNGRVRALNLTTGAENSIIGAGLGNGDQDQEDPTDVYMRGPRGLAVHNNAIIFADKYESTGTNRNCLVRAYNRNAASTSIFNTVVNAGKVSTIAGSYVLGCNTWDDSTYSGGQAKSARLYRPEGIASDGTNLYIANSYSHCILKVAADGTISRYVGACNSQGNTDSAPYNSTNVRLRYPASIAVDPNYLASGNLFIADQTNQGTGRIKYVNTTASSIDIAGITVSANSVATLFTTGGFSYGVATFGDQICYTSGQVGRSDQGSHNVICKDRTDPLGNITLRVGPADGSANKGASQEYQEHEGSNAASAKLFNPYGLAFDANGNLYISERGNHVIRMVKRWW